MSVALLTHTPTGKVGTGVGGTIRHMETYNIVTYGNTDTPKTGVHRWNDTRLLRYIYTFLYVPDPMPTIGGAPSQK